MKILHIILDLDERMGGPSHGLATLARAQVECGDDVVVLPCRFTDGPQTMSTGRRGMLNVLKPITRSKLLWYNRPLKRAILSAAADRDILHIHGIWRYHSRASASIAHFLGIPFILRPYGNLGIATRGQKRFRKLLYFCLIERPAANHAAAIHCCSNKELEELDGLGLRPRKFVVPLPVEGVFDQTSPDDAALHKMLPQLSDRPNYVLYLGRICAIKNLEVLVEAFARISADFPDWLLVLAGPHENQRLASKLSEKIQEARLVGRIVLPGMVRGAAKTALLKSAAVFAQPSKHENFGISVAEALLFGIPCVVSDGVAIGDEIERSNAGIQCSSDVKSFECSLRLMLGDEARRHKFSRNAEALARRFLPNSVAETLAREYAICLETR